MPTTTSFSAIDPVADAVITALKVTAYTALCPNVGVQIPEGTALPYTRVGDFTEVPNDTAGKHGRDLTFALHVFAPGSATQGALKQAATILSQAVALLGYVTLSVSGLTFRSCQYESTAEQTDEVDGVEVRHLIATFRVRVMES